MAKRSYLPTYPGNSLGRSSVYFYYDSQQTTGAYSHVKWIIFISPIWVIKQTHDPIVSDPRLKFEAQKAGLIKQRRVVALSCTYERRSNSWSVCIVHPQLRWLYLRHLPFWWPRLSNFFLDLIEEETIYIFLVKHFKTSRHMK